MKIVKITKTGSFYKVRFDDDSTYKLHESIIIDYKILKKGIEVSKEKLERIISDNEYYLALDKGINYLVTLRSKKEVVLYLNRHFTLDIVDKVVLKLEELKLINESEFAYYYLDLMKRKHFGSIKIKSELIELGISDDLIEEVLMKYLPQEIEENCKFHFEKYVLTVKSTSKLQAKAKITNHLITKGFSSSVINKVISENESYFIDQIDEDKALVEAYKKLLKSKKQTIKEKDFKNKVIRSLSGKGFPLNKILKVIEGGFEYD